MALENTALAYSSLQDLPDYDMDEEDSKFFNEELRERRKFEVIRRVMIAMIAMIAMII